MMKLKSYLIEELGRIQELRELAKNNDFENIECFFRGQIVQIEILIRKVNDLLAEDFLIKAQKKK